MIRIRSKKEGFRRCGTVHGMTWAEYPDDYFTGDQLEALREDPMLDIEGISFDAAPETRDSPMRTPGQACVDAEESEPRAELPSSAPRALRGRTKRKD